MVLVESPAARIRPNRTRLLRAARSRSGCVFGPADCEEENTLLHCLNVVRNAAIERHQMASRNLDSLLG